MMWFLWRLKKFSANRFDENRLDPLSYNFHHFELCVWHKSLYHFNLWPKVHAFKHFFDLIIKQLFFVLWKVFFWSLNLMIIKIVHSFQLLVHQNYIHRKIDVHNRLLFITVTHNSRYSTIVYIWAGIRTVSGVAVLSVQFLNIYFFDTFGNKKVFNRN